MIWKTGTHEFSATLCQKTGRTCPALAGMARALAKAMDAASPATTDEFEIEGSSALSHCAEGCDARFRADGSKIRIYCGADADTPSDRLEDFADLMFEGRDRTMLAGTMRTPCAMLQALAIAPRAVVPATQQANV